MLLLLSCSLVEPTPVYPGGRRGNNSRPHAKIATASPSQGVAREARHSLPGGPRGNLASENYLFAILRQNEYTKGLPVVPSRTHVSR